MVWRSIGWPVGFWLVACIGLAAVVAYQLSNSFPLAPSVTAAPPSTPALDLAEPPPLPRSPDAAAVEVMRARPLFSESRRPYVPPPVPAGTAASEPSQPALPLELAGTYLTGTDRAALLLAVGGTPTWLRKGEQIEGWQIEAITQDRVELRRDDRHRVLRLRDDIAVATTTPPRGRRDRESFREGATDPPHEDEETDEETGEETEE